MLIYVTISWLDVVGVSVLSWVLHDIDCGLMCFCLTCHDVYYFVVAFGLVGLLGIAGFLLLCLLI